MREFLLTLSLSLPLSVSAFAQDVEIPEGSKFQQDTFLHADFWTYEVDGYTGNTQKNKSIRREQISSFVYNGKRVCTVEYFEVVGSYCSEEFGGLAFRHGSSDDRGVELSCELNFISPDLIELIATQTTRFSHQNFLMRDTSLVTWAYDEKRQQWFQQGYRGSYYQETVIDEGIDYYGQRVPFSRTEISDNNYGIPIKCRGDTTWIRASPNP